MIRDHQIQDPGQQAVPEQLAVRGLADRGSALEGGLTVSNFFCGQHQVVGARFRGHLDPSRRADAIIGSASELDRWTMCACPRVFLAASITCTTARFSTPRGA